MSYGEKRGFVTYSTDRENEVNVVFIISLRLIGRARKEQLSNLGGRTVKYGPQIDHSHRTYLLRDIIKAVTGQPMKNVIFSIFPELLLLTYRWPKRLRTLGTRMIINKSLSLDNCNLVLRVLRLFSPESLLATSRWPKSLSTLCTRLGQFSLAKSH